MDFKYKQNKKYLPKQRRIFQSLLIHFPLTRNHKQQKKKPKPYFNIALLKYGFISLFN